MPGAGAHKHIGYLKNYPKGAPSLMSAVGKALVVGIAAGVVWRKWHLGYRENYKAFYVDLAEKRKSGKVQEPVPYGGL